MAFEFYVSITGKKQGKFKGASAGVGRRTTKDRIPGIRFELETISPRDAATGLPTGKRQHKPVVITKEWDAASPQLFQALVANEVLSTVLFEFLKTDPAGREVVYFTIKLTDAAVSDIRSHLDLTGTGGGRYDGHELEDVSFTFRTIEITDVESRTSATDDWSSPA
jgi:type VI secretion system secreted protein Hcp